MAEILNTLKITPWWIPSSKLLAHRGCAVSQCCCMHIEWPIMLLPKRSHLHSCRCISPGSETWDQSQPCQCYSLATVKAKSFASSLSTGCQSWGQQATQICLTVCHLLACFGIADTVFLEILYTARCAGTAALPSVAAASGCAQCLHSPGLSPPWCTCHCSICGHLPPLALLLLILGSRANSKAPRAQCGLRACPAISLPWEPHSRPVWLLCWLWPVPGPAPVPSPLGHSAGAQFLWGFWASLGKDKVVGASRVCPASLTHARACSFVWAFDRVPLLALSAFYQEHLFEDRGAEAMMEWQAWVQVVLSWEQKAAGTSWMAIQLGSAQPVLTIYL